MAYSVWLSTLNSDGSCMQCSHMQMEVEASIKEKGQLYCYLSITQYLSSLSPYVVSPTHLTPLVVKRALEARGYVLQADVLELATLQVGEPNYMA